MNSELKKQSREKVTVWMLKGIPYDNSFNSWTDKKDIVR